eukprot:scaffold664_cov198-Alexandrium_tamarense.AAC.22
MSIIFIVQQCSHLVFVFHDQANPTANPTPLPTVAPVTPAPTPPPVTSSPTPAGGPQDAAFDNTFGVPRCATPGSSCDTGALLVGRGTTGSLAESQASNTLDNCVDGNSGSFHSDESLDKIVVRAGDVNGGSGAGGTMVEGGKATIIASVWAWSTGASDHADFYYASDANSPNWQYIGSLTPSAGGAQNLAMDYDLPAGANQAVRVNFRYNGSANPCTSGSYNDRDDVVFAVAGGTPAPTLSPIVPATPSPTAKVGGGGPQVAAYDDGLGAPRCLLYGSQCDSLGLLNGRGAMSNGAEPNAPNTLGTACGDGSSGSYHGDESIDKIVVRSGDVNGGSGAGGDMVEGGTATIIATVWPWSTGSSDRADFYIASDANSPIWQFLGTVTPSGSGLQELKMQYTLPQGTNQAVRVNFRYNGSQGGSTGSCTSGIYDDTDDLAFVVKTNTNFVGADSAEEHEAPKDVAEDEAKREAILLNESGERVDDGTGGGEKGKGKNKDKKKNGKSRKMRAF